MDIRELLGKITEEYRSALGNKTVGIYVHGSLAFGCFNPLKSDVDFIAAVNAPLSQAEKTALIGALLRLEKYAPEKGIEMSVVLERYCKDFIYPTPFELHYSIAHREAALADTEGFCAAMNGVDHDLAAHFTVIKSVGYAVFGREISEVFGEVPREHYLDSIMRDIGGAAEEISEAPVYFALNLCRALAYIREGAVLSKRQGGLWGTEHCPSEYSELLRRALECYNGAGELPAGLPTREFAEYMLGEIGGRYVTAGV